MYTFIHMHRYIYICVHVYTHAHLAPAAIGVRAVVIPVIPLPNHAFSRLLYGVVLVGCPSIAQNLVPAQ